MATTGNNIWFKSIRNPIVDINQDFKVVPMFAPKMRGSDCRRLSKPAFTKPVIITVDAEDDCIAAVIIIPEVSPRNELVVTAEMIPRIR